MAPLVASKPRKDEPPSLGAAASLACDYKHSDVLRWTGAHSDVLPWNGAQGDRLIWQTYTDGPMGAELRAGLQRHVLCEGLGLQDVSAEAKALSQDGLNQAGASTTASVDQVALHFRCGDSINYYHPYGLWNFTRMLRVIPNASNVTVGIITRPFAAICSEGARMPAHGSEPEPAGLYHGGERLAGCSCVCVDILHEIIEYIREERPGAVVTIRDGDERLGSESRLALAPIGAACLGPSSFCQWPLMASSHPDGIVAQRGEHWRSYRELINVFYMPSGDSLTANKSAADRSCYGITSAGARSWARTLRH